MATATKSKTQFISLAAVSASPVGVDADKKIIRGVVVAEPGQFQDPVGEPDPRGEFDSTSIKTLKGLLAADPLGVKSRYGHPNPQHPGAPAELDGFLGRFKDPTIDGDGKLRADLHLDDTAFLAPPGGGTSRGDYLMARAKSDPASFGTSLTLSADKAWRMDNHNKPKRDDDGNALAPLWRPGKVGTVDIVDRGAATPGGFLAATEQLAPPASFDSFQSAAEAMDEALDGIDRQSISAFLNLYMASRFVCQWEPVLGDTDDEFGARLSARLAAVPREKPLTIEQIKQRFEALSAKAALAEEDEAVRLRWRNQQRKAGLQNREDA